MGRCSACVLLAAALLVCAAAGAATEQPLAQHPTQSRGAAPHTRPLAAPALAPTGDEQDGRPARSAAPDEVAAAAAGAPLPSAVAPASAASAAASLPGPVGSPAWARNYAPAQVAAARKSGDNPLLAVTSFPLYDQIQPMHVEAGIGRALDEVEAALAQLEASVQPTWEGLVDPMTRMQNRLDSTWGIVDHLLGVRNSDALRAAAAAVQPRATAVTQRFAQSPALFAAFQALRVGPLWADLPRARRTIVDKQLLGFRLAGVNLEVRPY